MLDKVWPRIHPLLILLSACGADPLGPAVVPVPEKPAASPGSPPEAPTTMFDVQALSRYQAEDRAYVMGHAFGVYLFSRTLPAWIAPTGYQYEPGKISPEARVGYVYSTVIGQAEPTASEDHQPSEDRQPSEGADDEDGDDEDGNRDEADGMLDEDCETFLDPPAMEARELAETYDVDAVMSEGLTPDEIGDHHADFELGFTDSLGLEDLDEETAFSEPYAMQDHAQEAGMCEHSPLILDLDGDGIDAGSPELGVLFDLRQTGFLVQTSWPTGGDALLALDRNGDGAITDGGELFGNALGETGRYSDGFAQLAVLDRKDRGGNEDGIIDAKDGAFRELLLWRDADRDGVSAPAELTALSDARIVSLPLRHRGSDDRDRGGNRLAAWGTFRFVDEGDRVREGTMIDVWFRVRSAGAPIASAW